MTDRIRALLSEVRSLFTRRRDDAELDEEIRHHIQLETEANLRRGMSPTEARRHALVAFGGTDWFTERVRDERGGRQLDDLLRDLRFGLRNLRRRPVFTAAAVLTLGLGVGMTTTMFALVDAVLLRPLPGANAEGLVYLDLESDDGRITVSPTPELLRLIRDHATSFSRVEAYASEDLDLVVDGEPLRAKVGTASAGFFSFLGIGPALGRTFLPADGLGTTNPVVVLGHAFWAEQFGGDRNVLGRTVRIGDRTHEVIGVLPMDFRVDSPGELLLWIPEGNAGSLFTEGVPVEGALGKLADGATLESARAELDALVRTSPLTRMANVDWGARIQTPVDLVDDSLKRAILVLQAAALLVLLVGCVNLANLLLAQGENRARELAVRRSLGARRGRLLRQLLTESLLLGLFGAVVGSVLAVWGLMSLPLFLPLGCGGVAPQGGTFTFATGVALLSVLAVGLLPSLRGSSRGLAEIIRGGLPLRRSRGGRRGIRQALVTVEVAMTVVLLVGAGLLLRSFAGLSRMDTGFDSRQLLTLHLELPEDRYPDAGSRTAFRTRLRDELTRAVPTQLGSTTVASGLVEHLSATAEPLAQEGEEAPEAERSISITWKVAPEFFDVVGSPLLRGRGFTDGDGRNVEGVVIVSEALANRRFPSVDPLGRRLMVGDAAYRVVGVAGGFRLPSLAKSNLGEEQLYFPLEHNPSPGTTVIARVSGDADAMIDLLKTVVWSIDPALPLADVAMVEDQLAESLDQERANAVLMMLFAATALLLGVVGIYGVVAYSVNRRVREMGIRLALGASSGAVVSRLVLDGMRTVLAGMILGTASAVVLGRAFSELLHEVALADPVVFAAVLSGTAAVSLLATWIPARRAAGFGPIEALRTD